MLSVREQRRPFQESIEQQAEQSEENIRSHPGKFTLIVFMLLSNLFFDSQGSPEKNHALFEKEREQKLSDLVQMQMTEYEAKQEKAGLHK